MNNYKMLMYNPVADKWEEVCEHTVDFKYARNDDLCVFGVQNPDGIRLWLNL